MMTSESKNSFELVENRDAINLLPTENFEIWWVFAFGAGIGLLALIIFLWCSRKSKKQPDQTAKLAYQEAMNELSSLEINESKRVAIQVSLIIRRYLAKRLDEPALYETHEEFVSRHDALASFSEDTKLEVSDFFSRLAAMKYGPDDSETSGPETLGRKAIDLMERMHAS